MSSFIKDFQRGYRLGSGNRTHTTPRAIRFPYLDGIPDRHEFAKGRIADKRSLLAWFEQVGRANI
jgi:hypothetical protein